MVVHTIPKYLSFKDFPLDHFIELPKSTKPVETKKTVIHLYSGPNDGEVHEVPSAPEDLPHFFITPYMPKDENGMPDPSEENIVQAGGMIYVRPNLAYYQQITEEDYFYVRDVDHTEVQKIQLTGELPSMQKKDKGEE